MERPLEQYDKESMKMVVLKHEEIFKEQVYELHRLYRIQKLLMNDMQSKEPKRPPASPQYSENDVSLSLANYNHKDQRRSQLAIDLECPAEDYIDDDSRGILQIEQEVDFELTLGRGWNQMKQDETSSASDSGLSFFSSSGDSSTMQKSDRTPESMNSREMMMGHNWGLIQICLLRM